MNVVSDTSWDQWQARLVRLQRNLLSPVNTLRAYGDTLLAEGTRLGLDEMVPDVDRIRSATASLGDMVESLTDEAFGRTFFNPDDLAESQKKLRHDLRTPINAIKGYGEMLLEDLEDFEDGEVLRADFRKLLQEANWLLSRLYAIFDDGQSAAPAAFAVPDEVAVAADAARAITGRILVVDDIEDNREVLSRRLEREGHTATTASGGREALDLLKQQRLDLVLLDVMMPEMDGFQVLAEIKADVDLREIPVIMISAADEMDQVIRCIEGGAEDFLAKPFDPVLLHARITACLEKKQWRDSQRDYLDRMVEAMDRVERGQLDVRLETTGSDVYANLYSGFNLMVEGLSEEAQILDIAQTLSGELNIDTLLQRIMSATTQLLDADRSTLFIYSKKTDELWSRIAEGMETKEIRVPAASGIAGEVFQSGEKANISDPYNYPAFNPEVDLKTGYKTTSILCMPITNKEGATVGVTEVLNKRGGVFTGRDEDRLSAFTSQIAITLENAQLFDDVLNMKNYNESILKSTSNGLITIDTEHRIVTANDVVLSMMDLAEAAIVEQPVGDVFTGDNAWIADIVAKVEETGEPDISVDTDLQLADGKTISMNLTVVPLIDINDEPIGSMLIIEDISNEKRVRTTMARYMSKEVTDELLAGGEDELGGKNQHASILFSDIRDFTSMSEALGAREMVGLLNEYFADMVDVILDYGGVLDKYIGDSIMVLFGVPFGGTEDADNAVRVANQMMVALRDLNRRRVAGGHPPLNIGVGISTGEVVAGSIGSPKRMEYTVIGDTVNLASRLESANKFYGTNILIGATTVGELTSAARTREIDLIRVKGKDEPVVVFEAIEHHTEATFANLERTLEAYDKGLAAYRGRDWRGAMSSFEAALSANPFDMPSQIYLGRAEANLESPPPDDWDGVWILTQK